MLVEKIMLNIMSKRCIFLIGANVFDVLEEVDVAFLELLSMKEVLSSSIKLIVR